MSSFLPGELLKDLQILAIFQNQAFVHASRYCADRLFQVLAPCARRSRRQRAACRRWAERMTGRPCRCTPVRARALGSADDLVPGDVLARVRHPFLPALLDDPQSRDVVHQHVSAVGDRVVAVAGFERRIGDDWPRRFHARAIDHVPVEMNAQCFTASTTGMPVTAEAVSWVAAATTGIGLTANSSHTEAEEAQLSPRA